MNKMNLAKMRIGYVPITEDFTAPADRRRFHYYAQKRGFEIQIAQPDRQYDIVVLSQRADLSVWHKYPRTGKIICDFIDSYLSVPQWSLKGRLRGISKFLTGQNRYPILNNWYAIQRICYRADAVVCSTEEQKTDFRQWCNNVHLILDFHTLDVSTVKEDYATSRTFNVVWEGLASSGIPLELLRDIIEPFRSRWNITLHLVTDLVFYKYHDLYFKRYTADQVFKVFKRGSGVYLYQWNARMLSRIVCGCDIALIPIQLDDPFCMGKPENKLILFWRMGMPTLTTATPAYERVMEKCGLPMVCTTDEDWHRVLGRYIEDAAAREEAGQKGRQFAQEYYSEEKILQYWDEVFDSL